MVWIGCLTKTEESSKTYGNAGTNLYPSFGVHEGGWIATWACASLSCSLAQDWPQIQTWIHNFVRLTDVRRLKSYLYLFPNGTEKIGWDLLFVYVSCKKILDSSTIVSNIMWRGVKYKQFLKNVNISMGVPLWYYDFKISSCSLFLSRHYWNLYLVVFFYFSNEYTPIEIFTFFYHP